VDGDKKPFMELNRGLLTLFAFLGILSVSIIGVTLSNTDYELNQSDHNNTQALEKSCQQINQTIENKSLYYDYDRKMCIDPKTNES